MKTYNVQLLQKTIGVYAGSRGEIIENVPADKAVGLARAGMAIICGDEPGEIIDPATIEIAEEVPQPPAAGQPAETPAAKVEPVKPAAPAALVETPAAAGTLGGIAPKPTAAAMKLAIASGIDINAVPSASGKSITHDDVQNYLKSQAQK
jgi:pyruvate/2-oxoglutarate dehydrogenase complex dihydrolipoamide acyltransferase (E2) component